MKCCQVKYQHMQYMRFLGITLTTRHAWLVQSVTQSSDDVCWSKNIDIEQAMNKIISFEHHEVLRNAVRAHAINEISRHLLTARHAWLVQNVAQSFIAHVHSKNIQVEQAMSKIIYF